MYIKFVGGLLLICSASAIGFLKSGELKERVKKLQELKRMILLLQGELRFYRGTLAETFENIADRFTEPFRIFLQETARQLENENKESLDEIWKTASEKLLKQEGFRKEDQQLLGLLRSCVGSLDLEMQAETFALVLIQTEDAIGKAKEMQESRGRLYQMMGITTGTMLTILII